MSTDVPAIFSPRLLRGKELYRDLSKITLTAQQKTFLGSEVAKISTLLAWNSKCSSVLTKASQRYRLPYTTVQNWAKKVINGQTITDGTGRPKAVDTIASEKFATTLLDRRKMKNAVPEAEALVLLGRAVSETQFRQGKRGLDVGSTICVTTQKKLFKELNVIKRKPQILTDARLKACRCPRLSYIWGCVLMAYSANLMAENKWNADATTIIVSQSLTGSLVCTISDANDDSPIASSTIPDTLNLLVKWFALNNAGGESGPLVLIFAVPTMRENTFFARQVVSMSSTITIGDKGWIYFSRTRGGCHAMWIHYYMNVTIPTIKLSNDTHLHKVRSRCIVIICNLIFTLTTVCNLFTESGWDPDEEFLQPRRRSRNSDPCNGSDCTVLFSRHLDRFHKGGTVSYSDTSSE